MIPDPREQTGWLLSRTDDCYLLVVHTNRLPRLRTGFLFVVYERANTIETSAKFMDSAAHGTQEKI